MTPELKTEIEKIVLEAMIEVLAPHCNQASVQPTPESIRQAELIRAESALKTLRENGHSNMSRRLELVERIRELRNPIRPYQDLHPIR